jgi:hypothetical protein
MSTVDGMSPEFGSISDDYLATVIRRAEVDLALSRNDAARTQRIGAILDAAIAERWRRLEAKTRHSLTASTARGQADPG